MARIASRDLPRDVGDPAAYERLRDTLTASTATDGGRPPTYLFYLATPPSLFGPIVERLSAAACSPKTVDGAA